MLEPIGKSKRALEDGARAFKLGKSIEANPYLRRSISTGGVTLSSWWLAGYQRAKSELEARKLET